MKPRFARYQQDLIRRTQLELSPSMPSEAEAAASSTCLRAEARATGFLLTASSYWQVTFRGAACLPPLWLHLLLEGLPSSMATIRTSVPKPQSGLTNRHSSIFPQRMRLRLLSDCVTRPCRYCDSSRCQCRFRYLVPLAKEREKKSLRSRKSFLPHGGRRG